MTTSDTLEDKLTALTTIKAMRAVLEAEIKKLRAARTKLSQTIKALETLLVLSLESPEAPQAKEIQSKPKPSDHPALQTYRDVFHTYPQKGTYAYIVGSVGDKPEDLEIWRECCSYWMGNGWNPKNINGQLERYSEERAQAEPGGGRRYRSGRWGFLPHL